MLKKSLVTAINIISVLIIAFSLFILLSVVLTPQGEVPTVMGYSALRVLTNSMAPEIKENDMIIIKHVPASEIKLGDVISFKSSDPQLHGTINTHRVSRIAQLEPEPVFITRGDANYIDDKYPVNGSQLVGLVVFRSSMLGKLSSLAANPIVFVLLVIVPLLVIMLSSLVKAVKLARQTLIEEEQLMEQELEQRVNAIRRQDSDIETSADSNKD